MKKIQIKPYPNHAVHATVMEEISANQDTQNPQSEVLGNVLSAFCRFEDNKLRHVRMNIVENDDGQKFVAVAPHLVHVNLNSSIDMANDAYNTMHQSFPACAKKSNKTIHNGINLLDSNSDSTHSCYNFFIGRKIASINMLISSLEGFVNSLIPSGYETTRETRTGSRRFNRQSFQRKAWFINEKLTKVIEEKTQDPNFWVDRSSVKETIKDIYKLRNDVTHLNTVDENHMDNYEETLRRVIDIDLYDSIKRIIDLMNEVYNIVENRDFVTFSEP